VNIECKTISLNVEGPGIIFYSPSNLPDIEEHSNFLYEHYESDAQVQSYLQKGTLVGFGLPEPGDYILKFHSGYPPDTQLKKFTSDYALRLGVVCTGGVICFRDVFDLICWEPKCNESQMLELEDGIYHVTLRSSLPISGVAGDSQIVDVYLQPLQAFPRLRREGIPVLTRVR
jgi:hypothetical protein